MWLKNRDLETFYCDRKRKTIPESVCHENFLNGNALPVERDDKGRVKNVCVKCPKGKELRERFSGYNDAMKRYDKSGRADAPDALGENPVDDEENTAALGENLVDNDDDDDI